MKIPLSWLKEYIPITQNPTELSKTLTMLGLEVESMETVELPFQNIVVGEILESVKHPDSDHLSIAQVSDGKSTVQVICGAPNCRKGLKTAFAPIGASLKDDKGKIFKIKNAKLRGVESFGMLCSKDELQLSFLPGPSDGIIEFPENMVVGTDLASLYEETILEIGLTPNLGHCASILGISRELSAASGIPIESFKIEFEEELHESIYQCAKVAIEDQENCLRYACRLIKGVEIAPSPEWLVRRLEACGLRSVNNVVDATNYVLMELGHPLHAFDYDQLAGHEIKVRKAKENELFTTLDGKERTLTSEMLLICDQNKPVALAGIMGGQNSEVTEKTENVLIESAYFLPSNIRRTSKRLGLQTDSSKRFERGADPNAVILALDKVCGLIQKLAGGKIAKGHLDHKKTHFLEKVIACRVSRINQILGTQLSLSEVENVFRSLNFPYGGDSQGIYRVQVPTYRVDINSEIDLVEEVARIYGYDNIEKIPGRVIPATIPNAPNFLFEREVRTRLIAEGLQEFITCDLIGPTLMDIVQDTTMPPESIVRVVNPTSIEQSILRVSLLPGLLQAAKYNISHQNHDVSAFEVGLIHFKEGDQYKEEAVAGIILTGQSEPHHWDAKSKEVDFYDLKGICENVLKELGVENFVFKPSAIPTLHSGRQASIFVNSLMIGSLGEVHPAILRRLGVSQRIMFAELNLHDLYDSRNTAIKMKELAIYPGSERDWTITLKEEIPVQEVLLALNEKASALVENIQLLAVYRSDKIGQGMKNVTFRFVYRDKTKTIAQETVDTEHARLIKETVEVLK